MRGVVVDFAVEYEPDGAILVRHGLIARGEVDDAQPPEAETNAVVWGDVDAV